MFRKAIYLLGMRYRNDLIRSKYNFLLNSQHWGLEQLKQHQFQRCKEMLELAYSKTLFYKNRFRDARVDPGDFRGLDNLNRFPIITKDDLLKHRADIQLTHGFKKLFFSETSGSTGHPLVFYRDKEWDAWHRAAILRGYSWYDVMPWERNGYFWGYDVDPGKTRKIRVLDFLQNRFRVFTYDEKDIERFVRKLKRAAYLEGYSSMIYESAKIINRKGLNREVSLKMVKGTSERILDKYQEESLKAFGRRIVSEYGAAEAGIIAFECPFGNMHITMENVIVEQIEGEILVTNLVSRSFPVIRYRLGDYVSLDTESHCACGMNHHIIREVKGRVGAVIFGRNSSYPSLTLYYIFKNLATGKNIMLNYQAIQEKKGELQINVEQDIGPDEYALLENETLKYFGNDIRITIEKGRAPVKEGRKARDFISRLRQGENM